MKGSLSVFMIVLALCAALTSCGGGGSSGSSANSGPLPGVIGDCGNAENGAGTATVDYVMVYKSNISEWCVDKTFWSVGFHRQAISQFFNYGDTVVSGLESLFQMTPQGLPFIFEVTTPTGGAHTGDAFNSLGDTVTGDAFYNVFTDPVSGTSIPGFYGYVFPLHEGINVFSGLISGGWPTDWWADHRSPFPNAMDYRAMEDIGNKENDPTLLAAANAQNEIFTDPSLSSYDGEVAMFQTLYNKFGGFTGFEHAFKLITEDGIKWPSVSGDTSYTGDNNWSAQLTEYVIAYLQLGFKTTTDLTQSVFVTDGVGSLDTQIPSYTVDSNAVLAIASDHCSIRAAAGAGVNTSAALAALQSGDYQNASVSGGIQATCPSECTWQPSTNQCVAPWAP